MKERPIIFSGDMVRAINDGRKTQTRRVARIDKSGNLFPCKYGNTGDRLWVRETWRIGAWDESQPAVALDYCDGPRKELIDVPDMDDDGELFDRLWQQSTDDAIKAGIETNDEGNYKWQHGQSPCRWRPSIHMPRWASRITLEITAVRVERLQDISERDAWAEGFDYMRGDGNSDISGDVARRWFKNLWESINGHGSWGANPWVWAIEFRRLK